MQCASLIKEIARGKEGARSLSAEQARALWAAVLAGEVSDLELGAILVAFRIKGESVDELLGFLDATHVSLDLVVAPAGSPPPVVIPSYNGARHLPNLVPLLAMLLAERGIPVLVHGITADPLASARQHGRRVTTSEVLQAIGIDPTLGDVSTAMRDATGRRLPVFVPIERLAPSLERVIALRRILGVRSSAHTVVKLLQPFSAPALRLVSYTHPEYQRLLHELFSATREPALIGRGTEGEPVANARRAQRIDAFYEGSMSVAVESEDVAVGESAVLPATREAAVTAVWTQAVLAGELPVPRPILDQINAIERMLDRMQTSPQAARAVA
ncbi:MAG TPA: DNA-binding protein YbiB [Burkholderiaceae bacterium]|nr:DNA-binding protein YbiB [Burkholderiaceae bacterium]